MKHTFLTTRLERSSVDAAAVISFEHSSVSTEYSWRQFRLAVTAWTNTGEGNQAWEESCGYFNVGDALNNDMESCESFKDLALEQGIFNLTIQSLDFDAIREYDEVLSDKEDSES